MTVTSKKLLSLLENDKPWNYLKLFTGHYETNCFHVKTREIDFSLSVSKERVENTLVRILPKRWFVEVIYRSHLEILMQSHFN